MKHETAPIHPGEFIKKNLLGTIYISTIKKLAEVLMLDRANLTKVVNGQRPISYDLALKIEKATNGNLLANELMYMQSDYDLWNERNKATIETDGIIGYRRSSNVEDSQLLKQVGQRCKYARESVGVDIDQMSKYAGIDKKDLFNLENGLPCKNLITTIKKIAKFTESNYKYIFCETDEIDEPDEKDEPDERHKELINIYKAILMRAIDATMDAILEENKPYVELFCEHIDNISDSFYKVIASKEKSKFKPLDGFDGLEKAVVEANLALRYYKQCQETQKRV